MSNSATPAATANYFNSSSEQFHLDEHTPLLSIITISACVLILIIGICGNALVILVFGSKWSILKTYEVYLINLAVADLIATIIYPSKFLHHTTGGSFHEIGVAGCRAIEFVGTSSVGVSSFTLVIISFERFVVVKWPLRRRVKKLTVLSMIAMTWLAGMSFSGWLFFIQGSIGLVDTGPGIQSCYYTSSSLKISVIILLMVQNGIPFTIIVIMNVLTVFEVRSSHQAIISQKGQLASRSRDKQNNEITRMLMMLIVVYMFCVTPEKVFYLLYIYEVIPRKALGQSSSPYFAIYTVLAMLFMANSCMNPLIYAKLHKSFRRSTLQMFCSCTSKRYIKHSWNSVCSVVSKSLAFSSRRFQDSLLLFRSSSTVTKYVTDGSHCSRRDSRCSRRQVSQRDENKSDNFIKDDDLMKTLQNLPNLKEECEMFVIERLSLN